MSLNQKFGGLFGAIYLLVGILGFFVTSGVDFMATRGEDLIIFGVNPLHNVVHLVVGLLFLGGAAAGVRAARSINMLLGIVLLLLGIAGFFLVDSSANIIALDFEDNFLHLGTAVLALAVSMRKEAEPVPTA